MKNQRRLSLTLGHGIKRNAIYFLSLTGTCTMLVAFSGCNSSKTTKTPHNDTVDEGLSLATNPKLIDFGKLDFRKKYLASFVVNNRSKTKTIQVNQIKTSCPCVSVSPQEFDLPPGQSVHCEVQFDSRDEPEFRGTLMVDVQGYGGDDTKVFECQARIVVTSK